MVGKQSSASRSDDKSLLGRHFLVVDSPSRFVSLSYVHRLKSTATEQVNTYFRSE